MHNTFRLFAFLIFGCIVSCVNPKQADFSDLGFFASNQQLDSSSYFIFYGFPFHGETIDFASQRETLPVIRNKTILSRDPFLLSFEIHSDVPLEISNSYLIYKYEIDEDGYNVYSITNPYRRLKPYEEYPFPIIKASPGKESFVAFMSVMYGFALEGPVVSKKMYILGYHDATDYNAIRRSDNPQNALIMLAKSLTWESEGKGKDVALIFRDTVVSPIRNYSIWREHETVNRRLIDLQ